jgi:hypothetical protein
LEIQASKVQISKVQILEPQVLNIKTLQVQVLEVHILNVKLPKVEGFEYPCFKYSSFTYPCFGYLGSCFILQEIVVVHVSKDPIMNVNETIKAPQDLNTNKDKFKQFGVLVLTSFEFDPNITSTLILCANEFDHVLKNYPQVAKGRVEVAIANASNDFHVLNVNIDFALGQEMDVKASQTINSSYLPIEQVSTIHDLGYVST